MIKVNDIHYIAGFLDGEATFDDHPRIQVTSTDLDLIEGCRDRMELSVPLYKVTKYEKHHKQAYGFSVNSNNAIGWMMTLYPLLCKRRREKIKSVIKKWMTMRNYNNSVCPKGHLMEGDNIYWEYYNSGVRKRCRICKKRSHRPSRPKHRGVSY